MQSRILGLLALSGLLFLAGCASSSLYSGPRPTLTGRSTWAVIPLINNTSTPYAGGRAQQIVAALLGSRGIGRVELPPPAPDTSALPVNNGESDQAAAMSWAHDHNARYALTGSVDEWRYKVGLDGQPAVGFTLRLVDLDTGTVVWSGTAAATGGSREGIAVLAQKTLSKLLGRLLP